MINRRPPMTTLVLGHDGKTVMAGARTVRILDGISPGALAGAGAFLDGCAKLFAGGLDGTVISAYVPTTPWGQTGVSVLSTFMQQARAAGWHCTNAAVEHGSGWVTFVPKDEDGRPVGSRPVVHLGVTTAMGDDQPLFDRAWTAEQIARQLAAYADATGVPYRTTPGVTGCEVIRRYHETKAPTRGGRRYCPTWIWQDGGAIMRDISTPGDIQWERKLGTVETRMPWVHVFDINKQYLSSMAAVDVSWTPPEHTGAEQFSHDRPGVWQLRIPGKYRRTGGGALPPVLNPAKITPSGLVWVTTPIGAALQRLNTPFEVVDSWCAPRVRYSNDGKELPGGGRWMREQAERMRDALSTHPRPDGHQRQCPCPRCRMHRTLKQTMNAAVGMMAAPSSSLRRPDVAATIRDHARAMLLMKLARMYKDHRIAPIRVVHDAVFYASTDENPKAIGDMLGAVPDGKIGKFKWDRTIRMVDHVTESRERANGRVRVRKPAETAVGA